jgi:hypothetical protein
MDEKPNQSPELSDTGLPLDENGESPLARPGRPWSGFFTRMPERGSDQTDAQYQADLWNHRHFNGLLGIMLFGFQQVATRRGYHKSCKRGACKRAGKCEGRRDPDDWSFRFKPVVPPCVPLILEEIDEIRQILKAELDHAVAKINQKSERGA